MKKTLLFSVLLCVFFCFTQKTSATENLHNAITEVTIESTTGNAQRAVPLSFGQIFAAGKLSPTAGLVAHTKDGNSIPLQVNIKASHADGSVRHAILSAILPSLSAGKNENLLLSKTTTNTPVGTAISPSRLLATDFDATVRIMLYGKLYTASARSALSSGKYSTWFSGPVASEWLMTAPLMNEQNAPHPHLHVRYAIRDYANGDGTRVDVTVENNWAYQTAPQNFTYDVLIDIGGQNVYSKTALTHYHHARWRKTFWWGIKPPQINIKHNTAYLIASKAVPNYDKKIFISELSLRSMSASWNGNKTEPMGAGVAVPAMPTTGGRPDIGLLPAWNVLYLLTMDKRARDIALGTADLAGSWSIHYRDQKTDRPISIENYPYMTILGSASDTINPQTKKSEAFPACTQCSTPNIADAAHAPAFNYLPYLLTGDFYQLEELQFWAMWNTFRSNPGYRGNKLGLVHQAQVRDQAWSLRNIADAAYITPDKDPLKAQFLRFVENNLNWYNTNYTNNRNANNLGINADYAIGYNNNIGIAPWMDDFFTSAIGRLVEQGFSNALPLLLYKAKFPVSRMTQPGYCWIFGAIYSLNVRATPTAPLFTHIEQSYQSSLQSTYPAIAANLVNQPCASTGMANELKLRTGEMTGYSTEATGFPSNMQPALAYSVDSGIHDAATAWKVFMNRSVKPDYGDNPQFAIVPRTETPEQ